MAPTIDTVSIRLPGRRAARNPRVTPTEMAKVMAAKTSFSDGQTRAPISLVTGSRVRNEMPRSPVATLATYLAKRSWQRVVEPHLLAHALHHRRVDGRAAVLAHAGDEAPRQDAEQQEDQRDDGEQGRDDVDEATSENEQHQITGRASSVMLLSPWGRGWVRG